MKNWITGFLIIVFITSSLMTYFVLTNKKKGEILEPAVNTVQNDYWFVLHRKSKIEYLYQGIPGNPDESDMIKEFSVNVGIENERPTPLPKLAGREYWNIIAKFDTSLDPETAPYFLTLDVPWSEQWPYGPMPYEECYGQQCDWVRPGAFGLHGIASDSARLTNEGSSGCIRHKDEDITFLYNLLKPSEQNPIRYYIEDI